MKRSNTSLIFKYLIKELESGAVLKLQSMNSKQAAHRSFFLIKECEQPEQPIDVPWVTNLDITKQEGLMFVKVEDPSISKGPVVMNLVYYTKSLINGIHN